VLAARRSALDFDVVSNPEFLKEGAAVDDFLKPDRIVVGAASEHAREVMKELYEPVNRDEDRMLYMSIRSAELTKYAANAMLATKISFINEIANLAERLGADIEEIRRGIGADPRIGHHFIHPGLGYGGSCLPKDVRALQRTAAGIGYETPLIAAVDRVNRRQKTAMFERLAQHFGGADKLAGKRIALWGLAFKPNTDDMREAPSRVLMEALWAAGATVHAYDPQSMQETRRIYGDRKDLVLHASAEATLKGADALVVVTEWQEFRSPDFETIRRSLKAPVIFDGRNLYDPKLMAKQGFRYFGIGRGERLPV
jgi:UDPglucose 6-dehydrogenase